MPMIVGIVLFLFWFFNSVRILNEYERGVIFRLGRVLRQPAGPGVVIVLFPIALLAVWLVDD